MTNDLEARVHRLEQVVARLSVQFLAMLERDIKERTAGKKMIDSWIKVFDELESDEGGAG